MNVNVIGIMLDIDGVCPWLAFFHCELHLHAVDVCLFIRFLWDRALFGLVAASLSLLSLCKSA